MSLLAIASLGGAPGVTTTSLALARHLDALLVEADPAGADLAIWLGAPPGEGQAEMLAGRSADKAAHPLPGGRGRLLAGAATAAGQDVHARLWVTWARRWASSEEAVVADLGRLERAHPLWTAADARYLVLLSDLASVVRVRAYLSESDAPPAEVVIVGRSPYRRSEIEEALHRPLRAALPEDRRAVAALLVGRSPLARGWSRALDSLSLDPLPPAPPSLVGRLLSRVGRGASAAAEAPAGEARP